MVKLVKTNVNSKFGQYARIVSQIRSGWYDQSNQTSDAALSLAVLAGVSGVSVAGGRRLGDPT
jgi:hypothetical protein